MTNASWIYINSIDNNDLQPKKVKFMYFKELGLSEQTIQAIDEYGCDSLRYYLPNIIQKKSR